MHRFLLYILAWWNGRQPFTATPERAALDADVQRACANHHLLVRLGKRRRRVIVESGIAAWQEGHRGQDWYVATKDKLKASKQFGSVAIIMLIAQIVLPILIQWLIDNWKDKQ